MVFHILTIFPHSFASYLGTSLLGRAAEKGLVKFDIVDIRDFADEPHKNVDDSPYGGGPGMVMMVEPIYRAVESVRREAGSAASSGGMRVVLLSPRGEQFTQDTARRLAGYGNIVLICGRYEGVDERVAEHIADEVVSIGPYVLSGGELPAMVVAEAAARYVPGVLGRSESLEDISGSYPQYTRPAVFKAGGGEEWKVPDVLLSGDHKAVDEWRKAHNNKTHYGNRSGNRTN